MAKSSLERGLFDRMFNYDDFYKRFPVNQHDAIPQHSIRHVFTASLCRGKVLDVGCGTGNLADYYFGDYVGIDISKVAIEKAKEIRRKDAQFYVRDALTLEIGAETKFDTIVISELLEHLDKDEILFSNIKKWGKENARLIITCPNGPRVPDPSHVRELTIPQLRKKLSPLGKVKFYNWPGASQQILLTVDLGQKNDELLSLVMIVKDEEKGLEKAVFSCLEFVDNIVIAIDSCTTDKTWDVAKLYADILKMFDWQDDFSAARNFAHQGVKTKWILFLDGHEYVAKNNNLEKMLISSSDGLLVLVELESGFTFQSPRIYKTGVQFRGKVHEKLASKTVELFLNFLIKHDRFGSQSPAAVAARDQQRDDMIPRLMGEEIKKNPKNIRALFHLGLYWQSKGNFKKALSFYSRYLKFSQNKQERWFVFFHRALCFMSLDRNFRAFWSASRADWEMPGRWEIAKLKGLIFVYQKRFSRALEYFVDSFKNNPVDTLYRPWARNDSGTWNLIGECFFNLRNFDKANIAFDRAAALCEEKNAKEFFEKRAALMRDILKESIRK